MKKIFIFYTLLIGLYQETNSGFALGGGFHHHTNWTRIHQRHLQRLALAQAAWRKNFDANIQPVIDKINTMTQTASSRCDIIQLQTDAINQINGCKQSAYAISKDTAAIPPIIKKIKQIFIDFTDNAMQQCNFKE